MVRVYFSVLTITLYEIRLNMARLDKLQAPDQLTRAGFLSRFVGGLLVIIGSPKAILFYIVVLSGFFDVTRVTTLDIQLVGLVLAAVPFCVNVILAVILNRASLLFAS